MGLFDSYSDIQKFGLGAGAGSLGSGIAGMFGGGKNPYDAASKYYDQIPGKMGQYFDPYINAGKDAMGKLQGEYGSLIGGRGALQDQYNGLMNDPAAMMNKFGGGYQKSPGFDWQMNQGMNAANNAAAAGGMAGSPQHQQQASTMATGLANQDYYNYLNHALGMYNTGLQGNAGLYGMGIHGLEGINQMGYNASDQMAGGIANSLMNQGNMAFSGQASQNQSRGQGMGDMFSGLMSLAAFL